MIAQTAVWLVAAAALVRHAALTATGAPAETGAVTG